LQKKKKGVAGLPHQQEERCAQTCSAQLSKIAREWWATMGADMSRRICGSCTTQQRAGLQCGVE
jgi:hypothetical protein